MAIFKKLSPGTAVLLLLSKVTQKHFRQPYRPSKVPLHPAGSFSSLRSVCLCPVISLHEYIPDHHDTVCPPDTSSGQHPFPFLSVSISHPLKPAGIPHSVILYQAISPMTRCRIFKIPTKDALNQGSLSNVLQKLPSSHLQLFLVCNLYRSVPRPCEKQTRRNLVRCRRKAVAGM